MFWSRALGTSALILVAGSAIAAPPSSCARKFVGTWQHSTSNIATLTLDGRAICSGNPFCQQGTWTCNGNDLTYTNSSGTFVYTLQPSGVMTYGSIVVTRIGGSGAPVASKPAATAAPVKLSGRGSSPIQTEYQPRGSQPLRAGKKIAADPAPEGQDVGQQGAWDINEFVKDSGKVQPTFNPAKRLMQVLSKRNREQAEKDAQEKSAEDEK